MACDRTTLMAEAMENGFSGLAQVPSSWRSAVLELLNEATGNPKTRDELMTEAEASGFVAAARNPALFRALVIQLACNASE